MRNYYGEYPASPWYIRSDVGSFGATFTWSKRTMGGDSQRQSFIYQCSFLDFTNGSAVAWFTAWIRQVGHGLPTFSPVGQQRHLAESPRYFEWWTGTWMVDDWCHLLQGTPPCRRGEGRQPGNGGNKRGLNTKVHLAVDARGLPVRAPVTSGTTADCTQAVALIDGFAAEYLLADKGYDSNAVIAEAVRAGIKVVIPPKKNRKEQREYDKELYRVRHLVENAFLHLKRWRRIATRYAKNASSFASSVHVRCISIWLTALTRDNT